MNRQRFILLLIAAVAAISGAFYLSTQRNLSRDMHGLALFPTLAGELDTIGSVSLRKGGAAPIVTLHKVADQWTVAERAEYPADVAKLRKLLLSLGDAKIVEDKTSNPASFSSIGVEDPAQAGATGTEITVSARDGKHAVIVGKPVGEGSFARRSAENQSYLVEPAISFDTEPRYWLDSKLLDVASAQVQSIAVKPAAGAAYTLRRLDPKDGTFTLDGVPAARKPLDPQALAPPPTMLSGLNPEDVAASKDIDFGGSSEAILTLTDGDVLTLTGVTVGNKHWIQVKSVKNAALNAKAQGRAFEVASYRYDGIFRPVEQLLVPKEPPAPKVAPAKSPLGGAVPTARAAASPLPKKPAAAAAP
jgi:hypothetical protein